MRAQAAFVIHLARAQARRAQVARLLADLPIPAEVLDAVDGRAAPPEVLAPYDPSVAHRPRYPFALAPGEIACFLSHRAAWAQAVARDLSGVLLIEDDAGLDPETFARALAMAEAHPGTGFTQFQTRAPGPGPVLARDREVTLSAPPLVPLRTTCNLYSRAACERLLKVSARFDRPLDVFLQMHWVTGIRPQVVWPSGISEVSEAVGGTTIQNKGRGAWDRLHREVQRPLFRAAMKRRALKE
ncbi:glycosyltransferase family 25 protein [Jannaschia sp. M317]|uniref:glycosyltransferase family 25 protein n=1 Tax=Jannaschia sp. M317 TaxID=2867011 RepID=UPI0021A8C8B2|nr:glycosyltransferase family 25 protein [Jannaschia sp. M317]UWQ18477.1 glycosyltransferase family 25 protein [Jannaschia sp. M317]